VEGKSHTEVFLLGSFLDPEEADEMFSRNVCCFSTDYMTSYQLLGESLEFIDFLSTAMIV
jgi:hypothetical protein